MCVCVLGGGGTRCPDFILLSTKCTLLKATRPPREHTVFPDSLFGLEEHSDEKGWCYGAALPTPAPCSQTLHLYKVHACVFTTVLLKFLQRLLSPFCIPGAILHPNVPDFCRFWRVLMRRIWRWRHTRCTTSARGLTFCYYFQRRRFVLTYFGIVWGAEYQCKWNLLLPACWIELF